MNPIFFEFAGIKIYFNSLLLIVALLAMLGVSLAFARKQKIDKKYIWLTACISLPLGLVLSRLFYVIFNSTLFAGGSNPFSLKDGGFFLFGGFLGVILSAYAVSRKSHMFIKLLDCLSPGAALAIAIGRWGNFFNCECLGERIQNLSLQFFPITVYSPVTDQHHLPLFFWESLICLGIFVFLLFASGKYTKKGSLTFFFLTLYCCARTFIEAMREDSLYLGFIRISQLISALILGGMFVYAAILTGKKSRLMKRGKPILWLTVFIFVAAVARAFTAEFFMGADSRLINLIYLTLSVIIMGICTMFLYLRQYKYPKTNC